MSAPVDVFLRVIPKAYRGPGFEVVRNNVYKLVTNKQGEVVKKLVTQLVPLKRVRTTLDGLTQLAGSLKVLGKLMAVGSAASVATLGVCVVGFAALGTGLYAIHRRVSAIQRDVSALRTEVAELRELMVALHIKVDALAQVGQVQLSMLEGLRQERDIDDMAEVMAAIELAGARASEEPGPRRSGDLRNAANMLQKHRHKLIRRLDSAPPLATAWCSELAQRLMMVTVAEARVRYEDDDRSLALEGLRTAGAAVRASLRRCWEAVTERWTLAELLDGEEATPVGRAARIRVQAYERDLSDALRNTAAHLASDARAARRRAADAGAALRSGLERVRLTDDGARQTLLAHMDALLATREPAPTDLLDHLEALSGIVEALGSMRLGLAAVDALGIERHEVRLIGEQLDLGEELSGLGGTVVVEIRESSWSASPA